MAKRREVPQGLKPQWVSQQTVAAVSAALKTATRPLKTSEVAVRIGKTAPTALTALQASGAYEIPGSSPRLWLLEEGHAPLVPLTAAEEMLMQIRAAWQIDNNDDAMISIGQILGQMEESHV